MKYLTYIALLCGLASVAQAQDFDQSIDRRQDRSRYEQNRSLLRQEGRDARDLERLQRLRQRSEQRIRRLDQPGQASRPANTNNSRKNVVRTQ